MSTCRWSRDAGDYLTDDGEPCKYDEHGDRTYHCTARRTCSQHVGREDKSCMRCVTRVRQDIRWIVERAPLLPIAALEGNVNSEALVLAGPAANPSVFESRRALDRAWIYANITQSARDWCEDPDCQRRHFKTSEGDRWHKRGIENALADLLADDEDWHPYAILNRWHMAFAEDYRDDLPAKMTISSAAAYLDRKLHVIAQDESQDFPLFRKEVGRVRSRMAIALRLAPFKLKGAPCPDCVAEGKVDPEHVRLRRELGHFCWEPDCDQINYPDDTGDRWVCPRNREHSWTEKAYRDYIEERTSA